MIPDWYRLGLHLTEDDVDEMNVIEADHRNDAKGAMKATFQLWLRKCPRSKCTWMTVIEGLRKIGENRRARELELKYVKLSSREAP